MITYNNLYLEIRRTLLQKGFPGASLEARELVCCGSCKSREDFYRDAPLYVPPETEAAVRALVDRHIPGVRGANLFGLWYFLGLTLAVSPYKPHSPMR